MRKHRTAVAAKTRYVVTVALLCLIVAIVEGLAGEPCGYPPYDCAAVPIVTVDCPNVKAKYGYTGQCFYQATDANVCAPLKPECACDGTCPPCGTVRMRKAWSSLPCDERFRFVDAVLTFRQTDGAGYDDFAYRHYLAWDYAHYTSAFLPWHRGFVLEFENRLRAMGGEFSCITVPYWDADRDAGNELLTHPLRADTWGSWTGVNANDCLTEGPCKVSTWGNVGGSCLKRLYNQWSTFADQATVAALITLYPDFDNFRQMLEGTPHSVPHSFIGYNMASHRSPEDPLFFMHHANIDRFYSLWQDYRGHDEMSKALFSDYTVQYFPRADSPGNPNTAADLELDEAMLFLDQTSWTFRDMMHIHDMPGVDANGVGNGYVYGDDNLAVLLGNPLGGIGWDWVRADLHMPHECQKCGRKKRVTDGCRKCGREKERMSRECKAKGCDKKGRRYCEADFKDPFPFAVESVLKKRGIEREVAIVDLAWEVCSPLLEEFVMDDYTEAWLRKENPLGPDADIWKHYPCGVLPPRDGDKERGKPHRELAN